MTFGHRYGRLAILLLAVLGLVAFLPGYFARPLASSAGSQLGIEELRAPLNEPSAALATTLLTKTSDVDSAPTFVGVNGGVAYLLEETADGAKAVPLKTSMRVFKVFGVQLEGRSTAGRPPIFPDPVRIVGCREISRGIVSLANG